MTQSQPDVLVVLGHPDPSSYCRALAERYVEAAAEGGAQAALLALGELDFDPTLRRGYHEDQALEPDLVRARALVEAVKHVVVITPLWWGSVPAVLKGFFDRLFLPGWAFRMKPNGLPEGLLAGRSARLILTMDSPGWWYRFAYGRAAHKSVVNATLRFTGFSPVRATTFYSVGDTDDARRRRWLREVGKLARKDVGGRRVTPRIAPAR